MATSELAIPSLQRVLLLRNERDHVLMRPFAQERDLLVGFNRMAQVLDKHFFQA